MCPADDQRIAALEAELAAERAARMLLIERLTAEHRQTVGRMAGEHAAAMERLAGDHAAAMERQASAHRAEVVTRLESVQAETRALSTPLTKRLDDEFGQDPALRAGLLRRKWTWMPNESGASREEFEEVIHRAIRLPPSSSRLKRGRRHQIDHLSAFR